MESQSRICLKDETAEYESRGDRPSKIYMSSKIQLSACVLQPLSLQMGEQLRLRILDFTFCLIRSLEQRPGLRHEALTQHRLQVFGIVQK